jgi:hypothetical protein
MMLIPPPHRQAADSIRIGRIEEDGRLVSLFDMIDESRWSL